MRTLIVVVGLLVIPTLLQANNVAEYWRDRQYSDRVRAEEHRHELEIQRLRAQTAVEVAAQNRRYYHYHRPRIVGHYRSVVAPTPSKTTIITHRGVRHPQSTTLYYRGGYSKSSVKANGTGFSYSSSYKKRARTIGIGTGN